jgi:hypothetical protein
VPKVVFSFSLTRFLFFFSEKTFGERKLEWKREALPYMVAVVWGGVGGVVVIALLTTTTTFGILTDQPLREKSMGFVPLKKPGNAKLTEEQVRIIKRDLADYHAGKSGDSPLEIARMLGLAAETIRRIDRGETWGWVGLEDTKRLETVLTAPVSAEEQAEMDKIAEQIFAMQEGLKKPSALDKMTKAVEEARKPEKGLDDFAKS